MNKRLQFSERKALKILSTGEVELARVAFKQLFDQHFIIVYRVALLIFESPELAKETTHEIFVAIWIKRVELIGVKNFEKYLRISIRDLALEFFKKQAKSQDENSGAFFSNKIVR
jgi:DNA-directed RNA polymerase specialized sigma24 family protein